MADLVKAQLCAAGMGTDAAASKAALFQRARSGLASLRPGAPNPRDRVRAWYVPGRLELLGKHTDYAGGRSLLCALERGVCLLAVPRDDRQFRLLDAGEGPPASFTLAASPPPEAPWAGYPAAVARRLERDGADLRRGADVAFASDLPPAAGMSSSSALLIASFFVLAAANDLLKAPLFRDHLRSPEDLAAYLAAVESGRAWGPFAPDGGVGTHGGSEDHTTILCAAAGRLSQYSFCPPRLERAVPMPADHVFVVGVSGVRAAKTGSARAPYNRLARAAGEVVARWNRATGRCDATLAAVLASSPAGPPTWRDDLPPAEFSSQELADRLDQFSAESGIFVPGAAQAFADRQWEQLGSLVLRSHELAARCLRNQVRQTMALASEARSLGAVAASAFGAGFGGAVWALVPRVRADAFQAQWRAGYESRFPDFAAACDFFPTAPGPPAMELRI